MTRAYVRCVYTMFIVVPTIAIGRSDTVWFIEVAWLWMAAGVYIIKEK